MEQMSDFQTAVLGRTGLRVVRLGVSASYEVPAGAVERTYEHGVLPVRPSGVLQRKET
jgi:hypothetical protein